MTTQATTARGRQGGARGPIGTTMVTVAVTGAAALWLLRTGGEPAARPPTSTTSPTAAVDAAPTAGGLVKRPQGQARAAARREARVSTMGGLAELYAERQAAARAVLEWEGRIGGLAELYRDQARARGAAAQAPPGGRIDAPPEPDLVIYLVATAAEAEALEWALVRTPAAEQPALRALAFAAGTADEAARADRRTGELHEQRLSRGLPPARVIDLRRHGDRASGSRPGDA